MNCNYYNDELLNMTTINENTFENKLEHSSIYIMLEKMYHFICILMLIYIYTTIVYKIFEKEQIDKLVEVNKTLDLYFETQETMKENISNLQYKIGKIKKHYQKLKKQTKNKNKKMLDKFNKLMLLLEDSA